MRHSMPQKRLMAPIWTPSALIIFFGAMWKARCKNAEPSISTRCIASSWLARQFWVSSALWLACHSWVSNANWLAFPAWGSVRGLASVLVLGFFELLGVW